MPLKISGFSWKLVQRRLPTRLNLARKGVCLSGAGTTCPMCRGANETEQHLFFRCDFAVKIWNEGSRWWGLSTARTTLPKSHLLQHHGLVSRKATKKAWNVIWMAAVWSIWTERNNAIFKGVEPSVQRVADLLKLRSWFWLQAKSNVFESLLSEWLLDPVSGAKCRK